MAENIPTGPAGAVPPKKETGKVQPKKETVRINLPPKPSAAPTIKLPTLPPGGPAGVGTGTPGFGAAAPTAPAPAAAPRAAAAPAAHRAPTSGPAAAPAAAPRQAPRPAAAPAAAKLSPIDTILAIAAAVVGLVAIGTTVWMGWLL